MCVRTCNTLECSTTYNIYLLVLTRKDAILYLQLTKVHNLSPSLYDKYILDCGS